MHTSAYQKFQALVHARANSPLEEELNSAQSLLVQGEYDYALDILRRAADEVESFVDANMHTTSSEQWFSFEHYFEKLSYVRIEADPRRLHDVQEPYAKLYNHLALAYAYTDNKDMFREALKQAIRWNPMDVSARLSLADVYRTQGNYEEFMALSVSALVRASRVEDLAHAFMNTGVYFHAQMEDDTASAAMHMAKKLDAQLSFVDAMISEVQQTKLDADRFTDEEAANLLSDAGLIFGANPEVMISLLTEAQLAGAQGLKNDAARLILRSVHAIGQDMTTRLLEEIQTYVQKEASSPSSGEVRNEDTASDTEVAHG